MTTSHSDVPLDLQLDQESSGRSPTSSTILVRAARPSDLNTITDILAHSFHRQDGPMGWLYPLLKIGIQEDLRMRLRAKNTQQLCLVAYEPTTGPRPSPAAATRFRQEALKRFPREAMGENFQRGEQLLGTVELGVRSHPFWHSTQGRFAYISNLAVAEAYRRRGVAAHLLNACEKIALSWGFHDLQLHVLENNAGARQLYAKQGFQIIDENVSLSALLFAQPRQMLLHKRL